MVAYSGPSLPQSILDEISRSEGSSSSWKNGRPKVSRKEARKQQRTERKQSKAQFFRPGTNGAKRRAEHDHEESPQQKKQKVTQASSQPAAGPSRTARPNSNEPKAGPSNPTSKKDTKPKKDATKATALEKLAARSESTEKKEPRNLRRRVPQSQEEMDEDAYIARLEAKLGRKKGGKLSKEWEDDGLDDLLKDLDDLEESLFTTKPTDGLSGDEQNDFSEEVSEDGDEEEGDEFSDGFSESDEDSEAEGADVSEEWSGFGGTIEAVDEEDDEAPQLLDPASHDAEHTPGTRYIPPHLRKREETEQETEAQMKLKRQLKGLLNRLSEQNIASILDGIEELYRNHRRHDVTSTITSLIVDGISSHSILLDSYVVLHAALISSLHKIIGVEFAAFFLQHVVANYERHFSTFQDDPLPATGSVDNAIGTEELKGKETSNLIVLLSELYNFQVISSLLVYDVIRGLLDGELTEFNVELLLKITRSSGQQLRSDDPTALKDIIQIVHSKLPEQQDKLSSRTRFMIETLSNLKNNRIKKVAAGQHQGGDAVERMKKFLSGLTKKRQVRAHEPLRIGLKDLHTADTKGKWWLVGAAWSGDPLVEHKENTVANASSSNSADGPNENTLMKLARKQGMNTDIRRNIFVILMSSADYVDACDRLSQLRLTEIQQREYIRVILHCCGNEKRFNPYYTLVGQQLCRLSKSHQFTLQYCLWDFLRDLGETNVGGAEILKTVKDDGGNFDLKRISETRMGNVARAYGWWIAKDSCTLAILKPVDFTILQPQSRTFLSNLLVHTLISSQLTTPLLSTNVKDFPDTHHRGPLEEIFIKATRIPALALGLIYFIGEMEHAGTETSESGFLKWARKVALDTLKTGMDVVPNL